MELLEQADNVLGTDLNFLNEDLAKLMSQTEKSDALLSGRGWIEKEADFVDEIILKVGQRNGPGSKIVNDSVNSDYFVSLVEQEVRKESLFQTPEDRVKLAAKYFTGVCIPSEVLTKYQKNTETSGLLREHGTVLYKEKNLQGALHYYNLALMFSEMDTEAAGVAYGNRSAVLVELGHFEEAIEDIDLALKNKYPASRSPKLEQRRVKCQESTHNKQEEYLAIDAKLRKEIESEVQKMKEMRNEIFQLEKPNPFMPATRKFVDVKFDLCQGRHLVVNRDVAPGTVIIVEKPYISKLYGQSKWDTAHCHNCLKRIWRGIPCPGCVFAIYCDDSCRTEAQNIHRYECKLLPSLHSIFVVDHVHMALRIILKVGPKKLFQIFANKDAAYFIPKGPFGTKLNDCVYDSQSYLSVFHLTSGSDKVILMRRYGHAKVALAVTEILETSTDFFEDIPPVNKMEFKNFVAALVLRHIEAINVNSAAILEFEGLENVGFADSFTGKIAPGELSQIMSSLSARKFAAGVYPTYSLLNHSCDPNVFCIYDTTKGTMVVMANRTLRKGEPIFISYNNGFTSLGRDARQADLEDRYHFKCHCIACEQHWPTYNELQDRDPVFCCPDCSKSFSGSNKGSSEFSKCLLAARKWKCGRCGKQFKKSELVQRFEISMGLVQKIEQLLHLNRPQKTISTFMEVLDYFQYHLFPPYSRLYLMQDLFWTANALITYFAK